MRFRCRVKILRFINYKWVLDLILELGINLNWVKDR